MNRQPPTANRKPPHGLVVVISGPSGVGKSTIAHAIEQRLGAVFSVSMTTRPRSPKDREGIDYHFVDEPRFHRAIDEGELLEWARVFNHHYGTPKKNVETRIAQGHIVILEIDVQGAIQTREHFPDALMMFILPPTVEVLLDRLRKRGRESEDAIQRRYLEHQREIELAKTCGVYDEFLVNDDLNATIEKAIAMVQQRIHPV
ncbi:MAG: guanylate kinase [Phycisphaeraceae bacterium]